MSITVWFYVRKDNIDSVRPKTFLKVFGLWHEIIGNSVTETSRFDFILLSLRVQVFSHLLPRISERDWYGALNLFNLPGTNWNCIPFRMELLIFFLPTRSLALQVILNLTVIYVSFRRVSFLCLLVSTAQSVSGAREEAHFVSLELFRETAISLCNDA